MKILNNMAYILMYHNKEYFLLTDPLHDHILTLRGPRKSLVLSDLK